MRRRQALKYFMVVAAGSAILPACMQENSKSSFLLKNIKLSAEQEKVLAELAETIIPASATPGAKDTYAHLFALRMVDDCFDSEEQTSFLKGFKEFEEVVKKNHQVSFVNATLAQRTATLSALEKGEASEEVLSFYKSMKSLTIKGYLTSRPVLGDLFHYQLVPGRYNGATPIKSVILQA